jgi:hypothetical protein
MDVTNSEQDKGLKCCFPHVRAMKVSRFALPNKEKTTVKRILIVVAAALMLLNTLVVPTVAKADGVGGTKCSAGCKP